MALATTTLPTWAAPPVMMPPLSSTSRVMKIGIIVQGQVRDGPVDARLLDHPAAAARRSRRRQRRDLGRAAARCFRSRSTRSGSGRADVTLDQVHGSDVGRARRRACCGTPAARISAPAASSTRPTSACSIRFVAAGRHARRRSPRCRSTHADGKRAAAGRRRQARRGAPAADRRRRHQRRPRPDADRREVPLGQHARRHPGVEEALEEMKPGLPGSRSTRRSSGRPLSSRNRSTT